MSVLGTRPNIIKEALIHRALKATALSEVIVHTGQHYDAGMSDVFFKGFKLPQPKYNLRQSGPSALNQTVKILDALRAVLETEQPTASLVFGDVDSTLAGALASAKMGVPVVHIEGGVRSNRISNQEEVNRRVADHISTFVFASTKTDLSNLRREGFDESRIAMAGDLVMDILCLTVEQYGMQVRNSGYILATIHRAENVESRERLRGIVDALRANSMPWVFPVHPRLRRRLEAFGLWKGLTSAPNGEVLPPQGYREFVELLAGADRVLTDSGGVRREAYILGKPVVVPIDIVWFPEIVEAGWMLIVEPTPEDLVPALEAFSPTSPRPPIFGDGKAHQRIAGKLVELCRGWDKAT